VNVQKSKEKIDNIEHRADIEYSISAQGLTCWPTAYSLSMRRRESIPLGERTKR
jgi:hypothetical protein